MRNNTLSSDCNLLNRIEEPYLYKSRNYQITTILSCTPEPQIPPKRLQSDILVTFLPGMSYIKQLCDITCRLRLYSQYVTTNLPLLLLTMEYTLHSTKQDPYLMCFYLSNSINMLVERIKTKIDILSKKYCNR